MRDADYRYRNVLWGRLFSTDVRRIVRILSITVMVLSFGCRPKPPDLNTCTRIELRYAEGALNHFIPHTPAQNSILSENERRYVQSCDTWTVTDQQVIQAFANDVGQGAYHYNVRNSTGPGGVHVLCFRRNERVASFTVHSKSIVTQDGSKFDYPPGLPDLTMLEPPGVKPLKARWNCAWNLSRLLAEGLTRGPQRFYPDPNRWCDTIVEFLRAQHVRYTYLKDAPEYLRSDASIGRLFACPSIHISTEAGDAHANLAKQAVLVWRSDYALNPNCRQDSPGDTVLLFESKAGWNQRGGPELFTFDNHDPKGGLVLLNDSTVKFIRTEEELKQLRWK